MLCQLGVSGGARWLTATLPCARAQQQPTAGAQAKHYAGTWGLRRPVAEAAAAAYVNARNSGASVDAEAAARRAALVATGRVTGLWRALALGLAQRHDAAAAVIQAAWRGARVRMDLARRRSAAAHIQAAWRGARARLALARRRAAAQRLQAAWRGARARTLARRRAAAVRIQAAWRGALARCAFAKNLHRHGPGFMLSLAPIDLGAASALKWGLRPRSGSHVLAATGMLAWDRRCLTRSRQCFPTPLCSIACACMQDVLCSPLLAYASTIQQLVTGCTSRIR